MPSFGLRVGLLGQALLVVLLAGCGSINYPEKLACGQHGECPSGQKCAPDGMCYLLSHLTDAGAGGNGGHAGNGSGGSTAGGSSGTGGNIGTGGDSGNGGSGTGGSTVTTDGGMDVAPDAAKDGAGGFTPDAGPDLPPTCVCNDDGNPCTKDMCVNNVCTHPNVADDVACTGGFCHGGNCCTTCWDAVGGKCQPGSTDTQCGKAGAACATCDDAKECTDDNCTAFACTHTNRSGSCNATKGVCAAGVCACGGTGQPCCPTGAACADASACSTQGSCGNCGAIGQPCCGATCTNGLCSNNSCVVCGGVGQPCCAGSTCGSGNVCSAGACAKCGGVGQPCCTGNACTDDANACNGAETCSAGLCGHGTAPNCVDANPCTDDTCDATLGCQHPANTATCSDGNACTTADHCVNKACVGGAPPTCPGPAAGANQKCNLGACDPASGCVIIPVGNGTGCDDATVCNGHEQCVGGVCTGGASMVCTGSNPCVTYSCDATTGCKTTNVGNNTSCADANVCNGTETCQNGTCSAGTAVTCGTGLRCVSPSGCVCDAVSCPSPANMCVTSTRCYVNYYAITADSKLNSSLVRFDLSGAGSVKTLFPLGFNCNGLASQGDGTLWTICTDSTGFSTLYHLSLDGTVKPQFGLGNGLTNGITWNKDKGVFFALAADKNGFTTLYAIDLGGSSKAQFGLGNNITGITYEPKSSRFYGPMDDGSGFFNLVWWDLSGGAPHPLFGMGFGQTGGITVTSDANQFYSIGTSATTGVSSLFSVNLSGAVSNQFSVGSGFTQSGLTGL